jgi:hypothetical protein
VEKNNQKDQNVPQKDRWSEPQTEKPKEVRKFEGDRIDNLSFSKGNLIIKRG